MKFRQLSWAFFLTTLFHGSALGAPIFFTATDIADENTGDDLWRYEYFVANETGIEIDTFVIYFDWLSYDFNIVDLGFGDEVRLSDYGTPAGWDGIAAPDIEDPLNPLFAEDGFFEFNLQALGLFDPAPPIGEILAADAIDGFFLDFIWRGGGTPGEQFFEYYSSADPFGLPVGDGFTMLLTEERPVPVPEPGTGLLLGLGLFALAVQRRRRFWSHPRPRMVLQKS